MRMNQSYELARDGAALLELQTEGRFRVGGARAEAALNALFSADLEIVAPYKGAIGLFLDDAAGVIAIAAVFKAADDFYVFTEAASADALWRHLSSELPAQGAELEDLRATHDWLCILGPRAQDTMSKSAGDHILGLPYLAFEENEALGALVFRMGFCGEYEYRMLLPAGHGAEAAARLLRDGAEFGIGRAEAAVLPTLMLEMRSLALADLPPGGNPIEAGLHWMINFRKDGLRADAALQRIKAAPQRRALMLRLRDAGRAADGDRLAIEGKDLGYLARVLHSPTLGEDIGLAFVEPGFGQVGVTFEVLGARGATRALGVSAPLFVTKTVRSA
jgi:glycine cleavage system aminomethyltransferase T